MTYYTDDTCQGLDPVLQYNFSCFFFFFFFPYLAFWEEKGEVFVNIYFFNLKNVDVENHS